jgi:hypothetical protein
MVGGLPAVPDPATAKRRGRCVFSQASTVCGEPGTRHQDASSTRSADLGTAAGRESAPPSAPGAAVSLAAPGGGTNDARIDAASAAARLRGVADAAGPDGDPEADADAAAAPPEGACVVPQPAIATAAHPAATVTPITRFMLIGRVTSGGWFRPDRYRWN